MGRLRWVAGEPVAQPRRWGVSRCRWRGRIVCYAVPGGPAMPSTVRGAGLGLGIVQHFARAHSGEIEALPRPGGGTIMRLTLPLAPDSDASKPDTIPDTQQD